MVLILDPGRGEPATEEAAASVVALVEPLRVCVLKRVHPSRHVLAGGVDDQVEVVRHRAACVNAPAMTFCNSAQ
jgi:hypothetical protein